MLKQFAVLQRAKRGRSSSPKDSPENAETWALTVQLHTSRGSSPKDSPENAETRRQLPGYLVFVGVAHPKIHQRMLKHKFDEGNIMAIRSSSPKDSPENAETTLANRRQLWPQRSSPKDSPENAETSTKSFHIYAS